MYYSFILILVLILLGLSIFLILYKPIVTPSLLVVTPNIPIVTPSLLVVTPSLPVVTSSINDIAPTLTKEEVINFKSEFKKSLNKMVNQYSS
jgi:hypothetical protein